MSTGQVGRFIVSLCYALPLHLILSTPCLYNMGVQNASIQMPASAKSAPSVSTVAPKKPARKTRARKAPAAPRTRKAAATPQPEMIEVKLPEANQTPLKKRPMKVETVELKSIFKDYPRDGFALILLPVLLLEAMVKEILPVIGRVKVPTSFG